MKKTVATIILCICTSLALTQSNNKPNVILLTPSVISNVIIDIESLGDWIKKINVEIENHLKQEKGNKEVLFVISLHKDREATIGIAARPKMSKSSLKKLASKLAKQKSPRTKIMDYSFLIVTNVNKGCEKEIDFFPSIMLPYERRLAEFKVLGPTAKILSLQAWIKDEVIPIIVSCETSVDPKFEGVLSIGNDLSQQKYLHTDIEKLTASNPNYWRASMEMTINNQLIPFSKTCMHIAKGEFDKANRLLFLIQFFAEKGSLSEALRSEISDKLKLIAADMDHAIGQGIALHDAGKYKEAVAHYEKQREVFPNSAWLHYELYLSSSASLEDVKEMEKLWEKSKLKVYTCDPMYSMSPLIKTGKGAYLVFRKQEVSRLFAAKENQKADLLAYADIALDSEVYGAAAQLYWWILAHYSEEEYGNRNMLAYYLYCLDKLGDKENIKNFKGDFLDEFEKIATERRELMEGNSIYKAFERKD